MSAKKEARTARIQAKKTAIAEQQYQAPETDPIPEITEPEKEEVKEEEKTEKVEKKATKKPKSKKEEK